jgi:protoporphyrinogen oxidase
MSYENLKRRADALKKEYSELIDSLEEEVRNSTSIAVYSMPKFIDRPKNLRGLIIPRDELYEFKMYALTAFLHEPKGYKKVLAIDAYTPDFKRVLKYGLENINLPNGKILSTEEGYTVTQDKVISRVPFAEIPIILEEEISDLFTTFRKFAEAMKTKKG